MSAPMPGDVPNPAPAGDDPNRRKTDRSVYFTLVFEGELAKVVPTNPLKTDTPFGRPVAAALGDALEEVDKLYAALRLERARAERAEAALKPFADELQETEHDSWRDDDFLVTKVIHYRRARALLPSPPDSSATAQEEGA